MSTLSMWSILSVDLCIAVEDGAQKTSVVCRNAVVARHDCTLGKAAVILPLYLLLEQAK